MSNKIHINLKSFDYKLLDRAAKDIMMSITAVGVCGPIPIPTKIERFTVNRSPHVNKKSREQFEIRTHCRLIVIKNPTQQTVEALSKFDLSAGVEVEIKVK